VTPPSPPGDSNGDRPNEDRLDEEPSEGDGRDGVNERDERERGESPTVVLSLPDDLRGAFKEPFGPVFTDARALLAERDGPVIAVGDVVTYHLVEAGRIPDVAVLDGYTERTPVDEEVGAGTGEYRTRVAVLNPAATLTAEALDALTAAIADPNPVAIDVDGEEDLIALPAIVAAPAGASVVYGQPGEGMVHAPVTDERRERAQGLLERMDGDHDRTWELLGDSRRQPYGP